MLLKRIITLLAFTIYSCISFAQTGSNWLTFKTDGHDKSNGINLTIKYPSNWSTQEGNRPHVVQEFIQPDGKAYAMILILDAGIPKGTPISQSELEAIFTPSELSGMVPDGMQFINAQKTAVEGLPAGILEYKGNEQRAEQSFNLQVWSLNFIYNRSLIQLQFAVGGVPGSIDTAAQMKAQKPLFLQMANTIVLPDKWKEVTSDSLTITATSKAAVNEVHNLGSNDGIKQLEKDWEVVSEEPSSPEDAPQSITQNALSPISNTLNNGGGLGNLIFLGIFFLLGKLITYILNIIIFRESPARISTSTIVIAITSLVFLTLLLLIEKIHPNIVGMLTSGLAFGMWHGFKKHKKRSSIANNAIEKSSLVSRSIKAQFYSFNLKQKIAISAFSPFLLYFIWKGLAEYSFEDYELSNLFSGPWWFWAAYFICIIFLELLIWKDQKADND